jgi:hypothetical protein
MDNLRLDQLTIFAGAHISDVNTSRDGWIYAEKQK